MTVVLAILAVLFAGGAIAVFVRNERDREASLGPLPVALGLIIAAGCIIAIIARHLVWK